MSRAIYTVSQYLLDRANIHDTLTKLYSLADRHLWERLGGNEDASSPSSSEVFATSTVLDYTAMFGGEPSTLTPAEIASQWKGVIESKSTTQHVITGLLIELPQPSTEPQQAGAEATEIPTKARVTANVIATLTRKGAEGGDLTNNGGYGEFEMQRLDAKELGGQGKTWDGNPWRVSWMKVNPAWMAGNVAILKGAKKPGE